MSKDLFAPNGYAYLDKDKFRWVVGVFRDDGASHTLVRAAANGLKVFYPVKTNIRGEYLPIFKNYLFIEYDEHKTLDVCRATSKFIRVISARDDEGIVRPIMVRRDHIKETMTTVLAGRFNALPTNRRFYGKGSLVVVLEGIMANKRVKLREDIKPEMPGNQRVSVEIGGIKGVIEIFKLAL
jgi:hypothetical protein